MPAQKKILVIKLGALGDFIQALGAMKSIRNHHHQDHITLMTTAPFQKLAEKSGYFNDIWIDDRPKFHEPVKWLRLYHFLNKAGFDRVYDLQNNDRTGLYFKIIRKKPEWSGIAKGASHRNISKDRTARQAFYGHRQTLGYAGIQDVEIDTLDWMDNDISRFNFPKQYMLIIPGSAADRLEKRWPAEKYATLINKISANGITPVIIGTDEESRTIQKICDLAPKAINLCGKTSLFDLPVIARGALFAVGNDTGPMHMIAPTGCKTIVLFSRHSDPKRHAPIGENVKTISKNNLSELEVESVFDVIEEN